jgi:hypothetical protein
VAVPTMAQRLIYWASMSLSIGVFIITPCCV